MTNETATTASWIGTLGSLADQRHRVAAALAEVNVGTDAYFVPVSTQSVDERVRRRTQTCRLDAAILLVSATTGPDEETEHLVRLLGDYDVPVVIAFVGDARRGADRRLVAAVHRLTKANLGYAAPHLVLSTNDTDANAVKALAAEAQQLAAKRQHRRASGAGTSKEYPFVITQIELDRLMKQNVTYALQRHRERGESVAVWRDGRVVTLEPDAITLD